MRTITQRELQGYLALKREISAQRQRVNALERQISGGFANSWWNNRRKRSGTATDNLVAAKIGLEVGIIKNLEALEEQALGIETAIQAIDDPVLRELLRLRYFDGLGWDKLGSEIGYVSRQCLRLHKAALDRLNHTQCAEAAETGK